MTDGQIILEALHFSTGTDEGVIPACIVAAGTLAAGGYPRGCDRRAGAELVRAGGDKLSRRAAMALFPQLPADRFRE